MDARSTWVNGALRIGDLLQMPDGTWLAVEGVADSGRVETVYNLEVEGYHTYFVGEVGWGWSVWAHNADYSSELKITDQTARGRLDRALGGTARDGQFAHHIIPWDLRSHPVIQAAARGGFNINGKNNGILLGYRPHKYGHKAYDKSMANLADELEVLGKQMGFSDLQYARILQTLVDQIGSRRRSPSIQSMDQILPPW